MKLVLAGFALLVVTISVGVGCGPKEKYCYEEMDTCENVKRGIEADDLCEEFYQGLMRCYLAVDRPAAGIAIFRRLRQSLSISLGIVPSQESHELLKLLQTRAS